MTIACYPKYRAAEARKVSQKPEVTSQEEKTIEKTAEKKNAENRCPQPTARHFQEVHKAEDTKTAFQLCHCPQHLGSQDRLALNLGVPFSCQGS